MQKIEYEFINKEIKFAHPTLKHKDGSEYLVTLGFKIGYVKPKETEEEAIERNINRLLKDNFSVSTFFKEGLKDIDIESLIRIIEHPKPTSFPKFSNEKPFSAWNHINPEILNIRWDGIAQTWEYRLRNVGHVYDYQEEKYLKEIN